MAIVNAMLDWAWRTAKPDGVNVLTRFFLLFTAMSLLSACASLISPDSQGEQAASNSPAKVLHDFCTPAMATKGHC
jgi:hypothetical protein